MNPTMPSAERLESLAGLHNYAEAKLISAAHNVKQLTAIPHGWKSWVWHQGHAYQASVSITDDKVAVECTCRNPTSEFCPHVSAIILAANQQTVPHVPNRTLVPTLTPSVPPNAQYALAQQILREFQESRQQPDRVAQESGQTLLMEFGLSLLVPYPYNPVLAITLKIGAKRVQYVPNLAHFLTHVVGKTSLAFSKTFTYDPAVYSMSPMDEQMIQALQWIITKGGARNTDYPLSSGSSRERTVVLPPWAFERLLPLMKTVPVLVDHSRALQIRDSPSLPIGVSLQQDAAEAISLHVRGLSQIQVLPDYGMVLAGNVLSFIDQALAMPLFRMTKLASYRDELHLAVPASDVAPMMEHLIPSLRPVASVAVDPEISDHVIDVPMKGALYLDAYNHQITATVHFLYGPHVINALNATAEALATPDIIIRDTTREKELLRRLSDAGFSPQHTRLVLMDEAYQFRFFHEVLPALRRDYAIYTTDALDPVMRSPSALLPTIWVDVDNNLDWLEVRFDIDDIDPQEVRALLQSVIEKRPYHRLKDGGFVALAHPRFLEIGTLLEELNVAANDLKEAHLRLPAVRGLHLIDHNDSTSAITLGKSLRRLLDNLKHPDNLEVAPPTALDPILRDYQRLGFQWLTTLAHYGFGGILADDMGLGKTIQAIAFLLSQRNAGPTPYPALVICPASLMYNWAHEFTRFAPTLRTQIIAGSRDLRESYFTDLSAIDVLITSYPLLRRDHDLYRDREFSSLILDEAQTIKNHASQTAQLVAAIHSPKRFALTGTPVENSLDDLWSIFRTVFPELFPNREGFLRMAPEMIARRVRPFILRRLKRDVLKELPDKIETVESAELTTGQRKLYLGYLERLRTETQTNLAETDFQNNRFKILAGLTRLRQICCDPSTFIENYDGGSGKLELLLEIIEQALGSNKRMLIFSQFTSMLAIIQQALKERQVAFFYLDGNTPTKERLGLANQFNQGERPVFLISLKAGGTGLNLTGADTVILYDLWWNPAVEEQAADRAHRIGQRNVVQVIRLVTEGTIEEKMYELQQKKRDLTSQVIVANDEGLGALTEDDIRELLTL